jgi:hypothetical protein
VRGLGVSFRIILLQRNPADHRGLTESLPQAIDRVLGGGAALAALVDEIARIGVLRRRERADADADQAKSRRPGFARQQFAAGVEYLCRELSRRAERSRAGARAEIGALELERHGGAGKRVGLEPPGNLFAESEGTVCPQYLGKRTPLAGGGVAGTGQLPISLAPFVFAPLLRPSTEHHQG